MEEGQGKVAREADSGKETTAAGGFSARVCTSFESSLGIVLNRALFQQYTVAIAFGRPSRYTCHVQFSVMSRAIVLI